MAAPSASFPTFFLLSYSFPSTLLLLFCYFLITLFSLSHHSPNPIPLHLDAGG